MRGFTCMYRRLSGLWAEKFTGPLQRKGFHKRTISLENATYFLTIFNMCVIFLNTPITNT